MNQRKRKLPASGQAAEQKTREPKPSQVVAIDKPIYGGSFLARVEGKAVFVPLTLPGEQARIRILQDKRGYAEAEAEEILSAAQERITPACRHFGSCGGCHYQHTGYATQLAWKQAILRETFERGGVQPPAEIGELRGESWGYRNRIRVAFDAAAHAGYRGRRSRAVIPISECPIAAPLLMKALRAAMDLLSISPLRPSEISLFCNAEESALLVSLFVAHGDKNGFERFARAFKDRIPELQGAELAVVGPANEPPRAVSQWGAGSLHYRAAGFDYRVDHGAFFQVNRWLVDELVQQVIADYSGSVAWDLFAGVGLFARQLTDRFDRVIAVESAPTATEALKENLRGTTGTAVTSNTLDFLLRGKKDRGDEVKNPDLIIVDPPRAGLGAETTALLAAVGAPALVYVSCDPATLARDLGALTGSGYQIASVTLADLFPQTFHLETVVHLRRT